MTPEHKNRFLVHLIVFVMFCAGIILLTYDGAEWKSFLAMVIFIATGVVAVKTHFGQIKK